MNESVARMSGVDSEFSDGDGGGKTFALIFYLFCISEINIVYCVNNSDFESDNVDRTNFFFLQKFLRVLSLFLHASILASQ